MSFSILNANGDRCLLAAATTDVLPEMFHVPEGQTYSAVFDGQHVVFCRDAEEIVGEWVQGTSATLISRTRKLSSGFAFTFYDHGPAPQRLHALWSFHGPLEEAVAGWRQADFALSRWEGRFNRNHPAAIHLRTRGSFWTGADSAHVTVPLGQKRPEETSGQIHVGEFNPWTGWGLGFLLHHLE
jgi:hypothetical protein